jgi:DNA-binding HxlR family transcriptional regulator
MKMIQGRWKLPILFRLYADPSMRTSQLRRDMLGISQKMLTQHLRELEADRLIERFDFNEKPLRVEYRLSEAGKGLLPVLIAMRNFSIGHPVPALANRPEPKERIANGDKATIAAGARNSCFLRPAPPQNGPESRP